MAADGDRDPDRRHPQIHHVEVRIRRPLLSTWLGRLARWGLVYLGVATVVALLLGKPTGLVKVVVVGGFLAGLAGAPVMALLGLIWRGIRWQSGTWIIAPGSDGLAVEGSWWPRAIPRSAVRDGLLVPGARGRLDLGMRDGSTLQLTFADSAAALAIRESLGLGPCRQRLTMELGRFTSKLAIGIMAYVGTTIVLAFTMPLLARTFDLAIGGLWVLFTPLTILATWAAVRYLASWRLTVGSDGVEVRRALSRQFYPMADLRRTHAAGDLLVLMLHGENRRVSLRVGSGQAAGLSARLEEARAFARGLSPDEAALAVLDRCGRPVEQWRQELAELGRIQPGYRVQAVEPAHLQRLLAAPGTSPERRLAAAMVLLELDPEGARGAVEVAARASARSALRKALSRLGRGEATDRDILGALKEDGA